MIRTTMSVAALLVIVAAGSAIGATSTDLFVTDDFIDEGDPNPVWSSVGLTVYNDELRLDDDYAVGYIHTHPPADPDAGETHLAFEASGVDLSGGSTYVRSISLRVTNSVGTLSGSVTVYFDYGAGQQTTRVHLTNGALTDTQYSTAMDYSVPATVTIRMTTAMGQASLAIEDGTHAPALATFSSYTEGTYDTASICRIELHGGKDNLGIPFPKLDEVSASVSSD